VEDATSLETYSVGILTIPDPRRSSQTSLMVTVMVYKLETKDFDAIEALRVTGII
jgi:hypothetical protein